MNVGLKGKREISVFEGRLRNTWESRFHADLAPLLATGLSPSDIPDKPQRPCEINDVICWAGCFPGHVKVPSGQVAPTVSEALLQGILVVCKTKSTELLPKGVYNFWHIFSMCSLVSTKVRGESFSFRILFGAPGPEALGSHRRACSSRAFQTHCIFFPSVNPSMHKALAIIRLDKAQGSMPPL